MEEPTPGEGEIRDPQLATVLEEARALREAGRLREAIGVLRCALAERPGEPDLHEALGAVLGDAGYRGEAIAAWAEALQLRPESERARLILSFWLKWEERFEEALAVLREGLDRCPSRRGLWLKEILRLCMAADQPTQAINLFNELLAERPDDSQVMRFRSELLRKIRGSRGRR